MKQIYRNPLPMLVHLKHITTLQNIISVFKELFHQKRHIEHLYFKNIKMLLTLDSCGPLIQNLTDLQCLTFKFDTFEDFEHFNHLQIIFGPKEFDCECSQFGPFIPWSSSIKAMEAKIDTNVCTQLSLNLPNAISDV